MSRVPNLNNRAAIYISTLARTPKLCFTDHRGHTVYKHCLDSDNPRTLVVGRTDNYLGF